MTLLAPALALVLLCMGFVPSLVEGSSYEAAACVAAARARMRCGGRQADLLTAVACVCVLRGACACAWPGTCLGRLNCSSCVAENAATVGCGWCNVSDLCIVVTSNGGGNFTGSCISAFALDEAGCRPPSPPPAEPSEIDQVRRWFRRNFIWVLLACLVFFFLCLSLCIWSFCTKGSGKGKGKSKSTRLEKTGGAAGIKKVC